VYKVTAQSMLTRRTTMQMVMMV